MVEERFVQGNEACALGAIAANCRFFAGYPITPSTEIAEQMSILLPKYGLKLQNKCLFCFQNMVALLFKWRMKSHLLVLSLELPGVV